jgi:hypothetical protein
MITINQLTDNTQLEITYPDGDPNPTGDLVGRTVIFYPGKRQGAYMGTILEVKGTAYVVKVTSTEKGHKREIGQKWLCSKATTAVMLF